MNEFPTEGLNDDLSDVPKVDYNNDMKVYGPKCVRKRKFYRQTLNKRI